VHRLAVRFVDQSRRLGAINRLVLKQRARQRLEAATVQGEHFNGA
jgi:hypothetical protein